MTQQDLTDFARDKQALYILERAQRRTEFEALYGVKLRKLNKRFKPEPGVLDSEEVEG